MSSQKEISESLALTNNTSQWPKFDGYCPLAQDTGKAEIRLIDLSYDLHTTRIDCRLRHVDISASHYDSYFALSYCWGAPGIVRPIYINGTKVEIRKTVYDLLKSLGRRFGQATIWLDVLCINQHDMNERSQQVSIMLEIFAKASAVLAWFGKSSADSNAFFEGIEAFQTHGSKALATASHLSVPKMARYAKQLLQHPYFTRLWIIQEFTVAQKLHIFCGTNMVEWHSFLSTVEQLEKFVAPPTDLVPMTEYLTIPELTYSRKLTDLREDYSRGKRWKLADLQRTFSGSACEDSRDQVYGLRGLAEERHEIIVDYSQNIIHVLLQAAAANNPVLESSSLETWGQRVFDTMKLIPVKSEEILEGLQNSSADRLSFDILTSQLRKIQNFFAKTCDDGQLPRETIIIDTLPKDPWVVCGSEVLQSQDLLCRLGNTAEDPLNDWELALIIRYNENSGYSIIDIVLLSLRTLDRALTRTNNKVYRSKLREIFMQNGFKICANSTAANIKIHVSRAAVFAATCCHILCPYNGYDEQKEWRATLGRQEANLRRERWEALLSSIERKVRQDLTGQRLCYC